jgi:hypothetical protein
MKTILYFLFCFSTFSAFSQTIRYVSSTGANTDPVSATSWATSTTNLQGAINSLSATGGEVWIANGLYKPTTMAGPDSQTVSFSMRPNVAIYGNFVGNETLFNQRPILNMPPGISQSSSTTLSGEIGDPGSTSDNSYHVIYNAPGLTNTAILDGFVITGGNANGALYANFIGGGICNDGSGTGNFCNPTIRNCFFQANLAYYI